MNTNNFSSLTFTLASFVLLASCAKKINQDLVPAYFSGFARQIQLAETQNPDLISIAMEALCERAPRIDTSEDQLTQTVEFKDCERNGILTNGSITVKLSVKDNVINARNVSGQLNFKVLDPNQNLANNCSDLIKKDDTASCSISTSDELQADGSIKSTGSICGLEQDVFGQTITDNTCKQK